ncbi:cadherin repeat domain-containing protein [Bdellovibrio sp. HCB209]|uniref:cadherin repeat domain-containing protein n=1 Tax=Bdellovibrio sp. HCB209 TaxID=3394354 RepID=UPI0039B5668B
MRAFFIAILSLALISGCSKSELSSSGNQNSLSSSDYYVSGVANTRVFHMASADVHGLGTFVTELAAEGGSLIIPSTLTKGDYGVRTSASTAQPLDLVVKVYREEHPSGDFIFEAPLLGPQVSVTNVTTALYWLLKWGYTNPNLKISQNRFDSIVASVELVCQDCRKKSNSEVLNFIKGHSDLIPNITQALNSDNPGLNLSFHWNPEVLYYAWSSPTLNTTGQGVRSSRQLETVSAEVIAVNANSSTTRVRPASWVMTRADLSTVNVAGSPMIYTFTNEDQASSDFKPTFTESVDFSSRINIHYEVARANRAPECTEPIQLVMKANRLNAFDLTAHCRDIDNPSTTPNLGVTYALVSGPAGLTISSGGILRWSPKNNLAGQAYDFQVLVTTATSANHVAKGKVMVNLVQIPTFVGVPSGTFTEGLASSTLIPISNPEGDPLILVVTGVGSIKTGSPAGAGVMNSYTQDTTNPMAPIFDWAFTPSYLQTIGANGMASFRYSLRYNSSVDPNLDSSLELATVNGSFTVLNADDPPTWVQVSDGQPQTEGVNFSMVLGKAVDPNPNPSAITYSFISTNGRCDWSQTATLSVDPGTGEVSMSGYPDYASYEECLFQVVATDANGLSSRSDAISFMVTDTNRPVQEIIPETVTEILATENQRVNLLIEQMFSDEDITISDPRENLSWECFVNTTGLGAAFTDPCTSLNIRFQLSTREFSGTWAPVYGHAGTYYIQLKVTDAAGNVASHKFRLVVGAAPAPMTLSILQNDVPMNLIAVNEGAIGTFVLRATPISTADVNQYTYNVSAPRCYPKTGSGTCRAAMIAVPSSLEGHGPQDFIFTVSPNYSDGDGGYPNNLREYYVTFTVSRVPGTSDNQTPAEIAADTFTLDTEVSLALSINNTNRSPTAIGLGAGSYGCTGSAANSLTSAFTICINLAQNAKSGNTWQKSYTNALTYTDPDGTNDSYSFSFPYSGVPGSVTALTNIWTIKLPACLNPGTATITRTYDLTVSDGRGGTLTRQVIMKVQNATAALSCM